MNPPSIRQLGAVALKQAGDASTLGESIVQKLRGTTWAAKNEALRSAIAPFFANLASTARDVLNAKASLRTMSLFFRDYFGWLVSNRAVDTALATLGGKATADVLATLQREKRVYAQELANVETSLAHLDDILTSSGKTEREFLSVWLTPSQLARFDVGALLIRDVLAETPEIFFVERGLTR